MDKEQLRMLVDSAEKKVDEEVVKLCREALEYRIKKLRLARADYDLMLKEIEEDPVAVASRRMGRDFQ